MSALFENDVDILVQRIKHHLLISFGKEKNQASDDEVYFACCHALREDIMMNLAISRQSFLKHKKRTLYYLSMEYLPGKFFDSYVTNLQVKDLLVNIMKKLDRDCSAILRKEKDPGLGNGGLGRLASCFLDSLATHHYPACGYGLKYYYGMFEQQMENGTQKERPDRWLLKNNSWELRCDEDAKEIHFNGKLLPSLDENSPYLEDYEAVKAIPYNIPIVGFCKDNNVSVINLRLWSTKESPQNFGLQKFNEGNLAQASENTMLTDVLYPNDSHDIGKRIRLKQEFLLVSASIQDIICHHLKYNKDFSSFSDKVRIQINDTHPALVIPEMMRLFVDFYKIPWNEAWDIVQECTSYTNHTILSEALEQWDASLLNNLLPRQYQIIDQINLSFCQQIRNKYPGDEYRLQRLSIIENHKVRMAHLAFLGANKVNGVAPLHTEILKKSIFKEFHEMFPEKIVNITNGVTQRHWLLRCNPLLSQWISSKIGTTWITDFKDICKLKDSATSQKDYEEFIEIKKKNKIALITMLKASIKDPVFICDISPDSMFNVQAKRIHEYKRQLMCALHALMLYMDLKEDINSRNIQRTIMWGGKAAPGYQMAKSIIKLFYCIARKVNSDNSIKDKLKMIFIKNYNISKAEVIIPAADLSEQISTAGMEASGTGNMKFAINGALTVGTEDGANVEMRKEITDKWWPFRFGCDADEVMNIWRNRNYSSKDLCKSNDKIRSVVEMLKDGSLTHNKEEEDALNMIYCELVNGLGGRQADFFLVLKDLLDYYNIQKKAEELYAKRYEWAKYAINNIASMGEFSSDVSIDNYAKKIWGITPCPQDKDIITYIKNAYVENDRCKIC